MSVLIWTVIALAGALALAYLRAPLVAWTAAAAVFTAAVQLVSREFSPLPWILLAAVAAPFNVRPLRRALFSRRLLSWFRSVLPPMSETERAAIDAGSVWWDGELFSGRPDWDKLLATPAPALSQDEQAFLDGPVNELCAMLDSWQIEHELNDLPGDVWDYLKRERFFGMIIPKRYGGLEFSARAQSEVVMRIGTRNVSAAVTVMVPNSLGPGELLLLYGTDEQKNHYLPRLADGREIPAFALTGPHAGSDAGSMTDTGIVCKSRVDGEEVLGFRLNWDKRYITLGPIATLLGLAFKARDPDRLLGGGESLGITCALVPADTPGVEIGKRHLPGGAFQNGPTRGRDVFLPLEAVIGGRARIGQGWQMLMNCLAVGRAISLPALGTGTGKLASRTTGAYARVRRQFRMPIGRFEGVEEALTRIAGLTYRMDAARCMTAGAVSAGEKPAVLSAILKYHNTEGMRSVINAALDVHAGRGVCLGPANYLAASYRTVPVAITVEGANILTRSMIIFGQGAIRCHPYLLREMRAAAAPDGPRALAEFDEALFAHAGFTLGNSVRAWWLGLTGARFVAVPERGTARALMQQLSRMSAAFACVADIAMLVLGGEMKRREKLSARLGDVLSHLYMSSACLKQFADHGRPPADLPLVEWAVRDSLNLIQQRLEEVLQNFPAPALGWLLRRVVLPLGRPYRPPADVLGARVAHILMSPSQARDRLTQGIYLPADAADPVALLDLALEKAVAAAPLEQRVLERTGRRLELYDYEPGLDAAVEAGVVDVAEATLIREAMQLAERAIQVDEFAPEAISAAAAPQAARAG
ncbi:MAG TPA: acyl-CoA dehydrogenase [Gammaproteobacteria bacterium]|nr:acyl-CoA dehydrogenase [Gammaproteobacteria bacterium]